jgi:hypothetical protein
VAEEVETGELGPAVEAAAVVELTELEEQARSFARDSRASSTLRASGSSLSSGGPESRGIPVMARDREAAVTTSS